MNSAEHKLIYDAVRIVLRHTENRPGDAGAIHRVLEWDDDELKQAFTDWNGVGENFGSPGSLPYQNAARWLKIHAPISIDNELVATDTVFMKSDFEDTTGKYLSKYLPHLSMSARAVWAAYFYVESIISVMHDYIIHPRNSKFFRPNPLPPISLS